MLNTCRSQVPEQLGDMFIDNFLCGFQFQNETLVNQEIWKEFGNHCSILINNINALLLLDFKPKFPQAMNKCILIDFF